MRLDKAEFIAGQPSRAVRDFLRRLGDQEWALEPIARHFGVSELQCKKLIDELLDRGLLERHARPNDRELFYRRGPAGPRFASGTFPKPIDRQRAEALVGDLIGRIEQANGNCDFLYSVKEARLFGSLLDPTRMDFGDVDVAIELDRRPIPAGTDYLTLALARARKSGRRFSGYIDELCYAEREVRTFLKGRRPHLSLHSADDLEAIGTASRVIFPCARRQVLMNAVRSFASRNGSKASAGNK